MFTVMKLIKPFFLPPMLITLGLIISFCLLVRRQSLAGKVILFLTLIAYYGLSIEPVAYMLADSLEGQIYRVEEGRDIPEAIVVLASGARVKGGTRPQDELTGTSIRRQGPHSLQRRKRRSVQFRLD
jgi:hypothetical protein